MRKKIKLRFVDSMSKDVKNEMFYKFLTTHYDIDEVSDPDYIVSGCMGYTFAKYEKCIKIAVIGENIVPDFNIFDYDIGFDHLKFNDRYLRVPLFYFYEVYGNLEEDKTSIDTTKLASRKFCCYVVSNSKNASPLRDQFFMELCKYKKVDSAGRHLNNMGGSYLKDKIEFVANYKFNIAFENSSSDGYTTEKIMEPMSVNTIPIYWGNPSVDKDFNAKSFINVSDFKSISDCIEYIKILDKNDELYSEKLKENWFVDGKKHDYEKELIAFFDNIFDQDIDKARRINLTGYQSMLRRKIEKYYNILSFIRKIKGFFKKYIK